MSMDDKLLQSYTTATGAKAQRLLDTIAPAQGKFVQEQTMWIS